MHMADSCRSGKIFPRFGHDITFEDSMIDGGPGFAVDLS
jgi:hypothetical protein